MRIRATEDNCTVYEFSSKNYAVQVRKFLHGAGLQLIGYRTRGVFPTRRKGLGLQLLAAFFSLYCFALNTNLHASVKSSTGPHRPSTGYTATCPDKCAIRPDGDLPKKNVSTEDVDFERLANAIYKAEGGAKASRPYGVMAPYCSKKTPAKCRKGCIQTIEKRYRMWLGTNPATRDSQGFISYLSRSYAPIGAKNDPSGLNRHWVKNVRYFYV